MLVLNTDAAVAAFASGAGQGAQVTLGAEMGVALGPVGRNMGASVTSGSRGRKEGDGGGGGGGSGGGSAAAPNESSGGADEEKRKQSEAEPGAAPESRDRCPTALEGTGGGGGAPIFAYAHQRGLFVGLFSLEGAVITPRSEVNKRFYERQANADGHTAAGPPSPPPPPSSSPAPAPTAAAVATTRTMDAGTVGALPEESNAAVAVTASKKGSGVSTAAPTPAALLSGKIPPPKGAEVLYKALLNVFQDSAEVNELAAALAVP